MTRLQRTVPGGMRHKVQNVASRLLVDLVGEEKATEASARVGLAFAAAHRAARNPRDIENCSLASIAHAVAMSALTGLMPGGAMPACWLVPRGGELQWMISHRGLMQLSRRAGYQLSAIAVGSEDHIVIEYGEVVEHRAAVGSEPQALTDLVGLIVSCRRLADGVVLGRYWLAGSYIRKCAQLRGAGPVWRQWPIEMAQKTAIKWACARGMVPIESMELDYALAADLRGDMPASKVEVPVKAQPLPSELFASSPGPEPDEVEAEVVVEPIVDAGSE